MTKKAKKTYTNGSTVRKPLNMEKADLNNDKVLSEYERKRGLAIEKAMAKRV